MNSQQDTIKKILDVEWDMFQRVKSTGGPAPCQSAPDTFKKIRGSIFETWSPGMLASYLEDLKQAVDEGRNPLAEKYARMDNLIPSMSRNPLIDKIVEIEGTAVGFGWASTSPRKHEPLSYKARIERWLGSMEHLEIELIDDYYQVIGSTGLVIGTLVRKEKPIQGKPLVRRLRYSATYVRDGDKWRMVQYHRSPMPGESTP